MRNKRGGLPASLPPGRTKDLLGTIREWRNPAPAEPLPEFVGQLCGKHVALATIRGRTPPAHAFFEALDTLCAAHAKVQPALRAWRLSLQHRLVDEVRARLRHELARRRALTFDELLRAVRDPVIDPERSVRAAIRARYDLAIVDEFQDTDGVQWDIFRTLFADRLFLVGDPKQAIYGFRGGDYATYKRALRECAIQDGLTTNYRTDAPLVAAVHHLFARPDVVRPMFDPLIEFPAVVANPERKVRFADERPPLHVRFLPRDRDHAWNDVLQRGKVNRDLPAIVANDIVRELRHNGAIRPGDCAVLTRSNEQAARVARELQARGVPATVRADAPVTDTPEHQALLDVLRAIEAPLDTRRVRKALLSPLFGVTAAELVALQKDSEEWIAHTGRFRAWRTLWEERGILATVQAVLDEGAVATRLLRQGRERSAVNVRHLAELLQRGAHLTPTGLLAWLERKCPGVEPEDLALRLDTDAEAVQVVTMHGAKGLEYPFVWVPFLSGGAFLHDLERAHLVVNDPSVPGRRLLDLGSDRRAELEDQALSEKRAEDLRLTYVALTRARNRCVVYWGVQDGTSALGWLLHQRADMKEDKRERQVELRLLQGDDRPLMADLAALAPAIAWDRVDWADTHTVERWSPPAEPSTELRARAWDRAGQLDTWWRRGSFTGLVRAMPHVWTRQDDAEGERVPLADVRGGARFGTLVHSVLEEHDFRSDLLPLVARTMADQSEAVATALTEALRAPVLPDGFSMSQVGSRFTELAFHVPVAAEAVRARALALVFPPGAWRDRIEALDFVPLRGFLVGSIDLAFRHEGRWYIVDWKTNDLGPTWSCYDRTGVERAMLEHWYPLQYHLYAVALTRMLRARVPGFDYERDFGGVLYLFLRGMSPAHPGSGVFFDRPAADSGRAARCSPVGGAMTLEALREEGRIDGLDQRFAEMLIRLAGADPRVAEAAALASHAPTRGDVGLDLRGLPDCEETRTALAAARTIVRGPDEERAAPLVLDGTDLYLERTWAYQARLVAAARDRMSGELEAPPLVEGLFSDDPREEGQRAAVLASARRRLSLIAGGPGTGKTAVVVKLLALLNGPGVRIRLAAPTGKAAARMTESIRERAEHLPAPLRAGVRGLEASTVHRLLGWTPGTQFRHGRDNPLPADVVVVDEASMIDLPLLCKLLDAVPHDARLVLLGDPDQLASVELGSVFADLVRVLDANVSRLTHTWRYSADSGIRALAEAVLAGDGDESWAILSRGGDVSLGEWEAPAIDCFVAVAQADSPAEALRRLRSMRVLCAHRHGMLGVESVNARLEAAVRTRLGVRPDLSWYPGRPVMVTANDHEGQLFNGDVGVAFGDPLRVWFETAEGGVRPVAPAVLPPNEAVYASTVHKSQGSEFGHVVVVLPTQPSEILTRELLYTAVTRARERVTVAGRADVWRAAVAARVERMSRVADMLRKVPAHP